MASIQSKSNKTGKKTYYVVLSLNGKHKWIKAGSLKNAKILKKQIESLEDSERVEKLGLSQKDKHLNDFFTEYKEHIELRSAPRTVKRYLSVNNTFITFLNLFHPRIKYLNQITPDIIESYQNRRLTSMELKIAADGDKTGNHKNKKLPLPQTVNNEVMMLAIAFNWAKKRGFIQEAPTFAIKKLRVQYKREPRILTPKECIAFLKSVKNLGKKDMRLKIYELVFTFLLNTGLRSGELCNLMWDDVDLNMKLM